MKTDRPIPPAATGRPFRARVAAALAAAVATTLAASPAAAGGELRVRVAGVGAPSGQVRVALYADEAGFDARTSFRAAALPAPADGRALEFAFEDVPAGDYAVLVHHDVDGDGTLDRGRFSIPSEPWTGSTSGTRFRAPSWSAYAFDVSASGLSIALEL